MHSEHQGPSDYIEGKFLQANGEAFLSLNPARDLAPVFRGTWSASHVEVAVAAAQTAQAAWFRKSLDERYNILLQFRTAIERNKETLAEAITLETGKLRSEARVEIQSLVGRFELVLAQVKNDLKDGVLPGFPNEALRWHPHGVVAVVGPFNFPLHLCHAHVIPALLLGNTVVMKPSEVAPLSGLRYAQAAHEAGLPPGVLNVIQGKGATGAALVQHPGVHALAFTGSWPTGRRILEATLDRPELLLALEMGGKNTVVVCEDADIRQAAHEIVMGGYLTTGQRCTCTDRVLVHKKNKHALIDALRNLVQTLRFGDPDDGTNFAGPLTTQAGLEKLEHAIAAARAAGADAVVPGARMPGGLFRSASFHVLPDGKHDVPGYTDTELFGPDVGVESFVDDSEAIRVIADSPYGFANSVFTTSDARFARYYTEMRVGILNRNRSTNQASPRLPFGGAGRSGNFRPAGSFAARNLAIPVAVQSNVAGAMPITPALREHLPLPDLRALAARHAQEEAEEAAGDAPTRRHLEIQLPAAGALPSSTAWLERFYANDRIVRDKKPGLFDHHRSSGSYFASIDDSPLTVIDAMSQTATMPFGFNADALVRAYTDGEFGESAFLSAPTTHGVGFGVEIRERYDALLRSIAPQFSTVCFTACGAEANEKAYALCLANAKPGAKRLLAFDGSFHGRTLLALYASHSPSKRVPFEIAGYEVDFAPYPKWDAPHPEQAIGEVPELLRAAANADHAALATLAAGSDALLAGEAKSLLYVSEKLASGHYFAVDIEPMQSEGGDRYATPRFHRALRLLTRAHSTALIMDEVQCGFGLGGKFFWHQEFALVDAKGAPDTPDCVVAAKRAQVGVVLSRFADPEPTQAFPASLMRGYLHARALLQKDSGYAAEPEAARVEELLRAAFADLPQRFPDLVQSVRIWGFAFAFDLPTPEMLNAYLQQRFWRGVIVFGAGDRTVRYRLNSSFGAQEIAELKRSVLASLSWLGAHAGKMPPAWEDFPRSTNTKRNLDGYEIQVAHAEDEDRVVAEVLALEAMVYEPARRDPEDKLRKAFKRDGVAVVAWQKSAEQGVALRMVGYAFGVPLEEVAEVEGPNRDEHLGANNTLYSMALTVAPDTQGAGLGRALKEALIAEAARRKNADGSPRYSWVSGRNRVGMADAMSRLNDALGAFTVATLDGQYEGNAQARYYRQPVRRASLRQKFVPREKAAVLLSSGTVRPFAKPPASLLALDTVGACIGPSINKVTLCNYITPAIVRGAEFFAALAPDHPHLFFTSGRDETIDKSVRMLRYTRKRGQAVITFDGAYVGHTTACARAVSDPNLHRQGAAYFEFPRAPHPAMVGNETSLAALRAIIEKLGAENVLGIVLEPLQERTGNTIDEAFVRGLAALRKDTGVPVVFVETASAYFRSGHGPFYSSQFRFFVPDILTWWSGGQLGVVHVSTPYFVAAPLTFVSTWDGDELSIMQAHHQWRAALDADVARLGAALREALARRSPAVFGAGLHLAVGRAIAGADCYRERSIISPSFDQVAEVVGALG